MIDGVDRGPLSKEKEGAKDEMKSRKGEVNGHSLGTRGKRERREIEFAACLG